METSTQEHRGVAFNIIRDQQNFRLLELPPSLLDTITSGAQLSLWLKSTPPTETSPGNAVLCSDKQTFKLQQVHSSNSIFVVQPSKDESLIAIAKCEATLEAISQATSCIPSLKAALPVYSDLQDAQIPASGEHSSKQALLADTPVSSREYNQAWEELCAFELEGHAWRPTPSLLWRVWRSIVSACTIKGWPLDQPLDVLRLARTVQDDDIPRPILDAVVDRVRADESVSEPGYARINALKCVHWTGLVCLQARAGFASLAVSEFLSDWKDHLPEPWRKHATLDAIMGSYSQPSTDTILFNESGGIPGKSNRSAASAKATGPQARKWHEKFKSTRR